MQRCVAQHRLSGYTFCMYRHRPSRSLLSAVIVMLATAAVLTISGCSQKKSASTAPSAATQAAADKELGLYRQLLAAQRLPQAVLIAHDILQKYPGTPASAEVQKALPMLEARAEHAKLAALWLYQTNNQDGLQYTAAIYSSRPSGLDTRVQLVLRRHVGWPQSVYLYGHERGFVCKNVCGLTMHVDGRREVWKAYLPTSGEPALIIRDDQRFIAMLPKAQLIEMDVITRDHGPETLQFQVGGYDASKFLSLPKQ